MTQPSDPPARLDVIGLKCPLPVLKLRKALAALEAGALIEVLASDPGAAADFEVLCSGGGHRLISHRREAEGHERFVIQK